ncbi:serine/threonine-protein kinase Nek4 isoform X1 [Pleurodeles waltl]|uniref:serine/threonine-protein kinase Nek4 isoform X1 n=1 Tax=Pleurodeles waltl TaxID=8319 RepID=UPI003709B207
MELGAGERLGQYSLLRPVGKGSYGEVNLAKHRRDGKKFVIKKLNLRNATSRERKAAEQEAQLLSRLKHPNIVAYRESWEGKDGLLYIVMDFCEGGDLYHKLKEQNGKLLDETQVVEWFVQITMALQYLHKENIMHRDLKTQNIFLTRTAIIKVGDLGIARVLENQQDMASTLIGTPYYMSPELFSNKPYNYKSDVWALGCCVYEMATLKHAFNAKDMNSLVFRIIEGKPPAMPKNYSPQLGELIGAMLSKDPSDRPHAKDILKRPYIKHHISLFLDNIKKRPARTPQPKGEAATPNVVPQGRRAPRNPSPTLQKRQGEETKKKSPVKSKPLGVGAQQKSSPESILSSDKNCNSSTDISLATLSKVDIDMSSDGRRGSKSDNLIQDERYCDRRGSKSGHLIQDESQTHSDRRGSKSGHLIQDESQGNGDRRGSKSGRLIQDERQRHSSVSDEVGPRKKASGPQLKANRPKAHTNPDVRPESRASKQTPSQDMEESDDTLKLLQPVSNSENMSVQEQMDSTDKLLEPFVPLSVPDGILQQDSGGAGEKVTSSLQPNSSESEPSVSRQRRHKRKEQEEQHSDKFDAVSPRPLPSPPLNVKRAGIRKTRSNADEHSRAVCDSSSTEAAESTDRPLSARERRRLRISQEEMLPSAPRITRASSQSSYSESTPHLENEHIPKSRSSPQLAVRQKEAAPACHLSDEEFGSSTSSTDKSEGDAKEGKSDSSEMHDLVELMTQTLKMEVKDRDEAHPAPLCEFKLHRKYRDTLILHGKAAYEPQEFIFNDFPPGTVSEKVQRTIEALRRDVVQGLGVKLLEKVYDIMNEEDELEREHHLREQMGEKYTNYSMKVRHLKFFEENVKF